MSGDNLPPWADPAQRVPPWERKVTDVKHKTRGTHSKQMAQSGTAELYIGGKYIGNVRSLDIVQQQEQERMYDGLGGSTARPVGPLKTLVRIDQVLFDSEGGLSALMGLLLDQLDPNIRKHVSELYDTYRRGDAVPPPWAAASSSINDRINETTQENTMKANHLLALLAQGFTTVKVRFPNDSQLYTYKAKKTVQVNDYVVVDSPRHGMKCAQVMEVDDNPKIDVTADFDYKWIVAVVDVTEYVDTMKREEAFLKALEEVEVAKHREQQLKSYRDSLPEGSEARQLFENALHTYQGTDKALAGPTE